MPTFGQLPFPIVSPSGLPQTAPLPFPTISSPQFPQISFAQPQQAQQQSGGGLGSILGQSAVKQLAKPLVKKGATALGQALGILPQTPNILSASALPQAAGGIASALAPSAPAAPSILSATASPAGFSGLGNAAIGGALFAAGPVLTGLDKAFGKDQAESRRDFVRGITQSAGLGEGGQFVNAQGGVNTFFAHELDTNNPLAAEAKRLADEMSEMFLDRALSVRQEKLGPRGGDAERLSGINKDTASELIANAILQGAVSEEDLDTNLLNLFESVGL